MKALRQRSSSEALAQLGYTGVTVSRNLQQERPPFAETWAIVLRAVRQRVGEVKREYGVEAQNVELIEQPQRTLVIRDGRQVVQASISLAGDTIDITAPRSTVGGLVNESESIQIESQNGTISYIHDGEQFSDPTEVANIILNPVLDRYRMASQRSVLARRRPTT